MDEIKRAKVEIVEIGIDENLKAEIEQQSALSNEKRIALKEHVDNIKLPEKKDVPKKWEGKLDMVFKILEDAYNLKQHVGKADIIAALQCDDKELSPFIQKFKKYLKTTKEDRWSLDKGQFRGATCYSLAPHSSNE